MGRIEKAYETRFRWLLQKVKARRLEKGVQLLIARAQSLSSSRRITPGEALLRLNEELTAKPPFRSLAADPPATRFFCDAGLGGLARWLRGAGYEAAWEPGIDDDVLLKKAGESPATILTTDSMLMERRVIRNRVIPAYWLPPTLSIPEQLRLVFREFNLHVGPRRCMTCGGQLLPANKEALRDRIPPRTFRWKDEYFVCAKCGKLFWHGTHWERIQKKLDELRADSK
jgi:uncharacterized protein with PIN domain